MQYSVRRLWMAFSFDNNLPLIFSISFVFVCCRWVSNFRIPKAALRFPVLSPESISWHGSLPLLHFSSDFWLTSLYFCIATGPSFLIFLMLLLLSHRSRISQYIHGFSFFRALPSTSDAVSMSAPWMFSVRLSVFFEQVKCCKFASNRNFKEICCLQVFQLFKVEFESWAVILQVFLQFQLHCHHNQVVVAVDIRSRKCSALSSFDAGLESP